MASQSPGRPHSISILETVMNQVSQTSQMAYVSKGMQARQRVDQILAMVVDFLAGGSAEKESRSSMLTKIVEKDFGFA